MPTSKVALIGHPNCGKTSLFNALTGLNQRVGNFPGVTVDRKSSFLSLDSDTSVELIDLPGTNTLYPSADDERVAVEILRDAQHPDHPDLVIVVADATQLKRGLLLCTQVMDLGLPAVLALNMSDLLEKDKIQIEVSRLQHWLDLPVIKVSARKNTGLKELRSLMKEPPRPSNRHVLSIPPAFRTVLDKAKKVMGTDQDYLAYQGLLTPSEFPALANGLGKKMQEEAGIKESERMIANEMLVRYDRIGDLLREVLRQPTTPEEKLTGRLDRILLHRIGGYVILLLLLVLIFQALFSWSAWPMELIEGFFGSASSWLSGILPDHWLSNLLVDGILAGLEGVVIFIPQIAFLFLFIAILEESGYMSRVVFLMDRVMRPFGFSGKSVIPLIGGMACAIPSIMMTRSIPSRKERLITIMVTPLMSCSARIPVYVLLIALFVPSENVLGVLNLQGLVMMGMYLLGFLLALASAWVFKLVLGYKSDGFFVTELPVFRMPRWKNVGLTIYRKCRTFVWEAGRIILGISIVLWFLLSFAPGNAFEEINKQYESRFSRPGISKEEKRTLILDMEAEKLETSYAGRMGQFIEPAIRPLGFDWKIGISLVTSFAAREVFVGTMSVIYRTEDALGADDEAEGEQRMTRLRDRMLAERDPETGAQVYTLAVALSLLVFYAIAMQCMSTLAVTRKETGTWKWPLIMLGYLTGLAYLASFITYQIFVY